MDLSKLENIKKRAAEQRAAVKNNSGKLASAGSTSASQQDRVAIVRAAHIVSEYPQLAGIFTGVNKAWMETFMLVAIKDDSQTKFDEALEFIDSIDEAPLTDDDKVAAKNSALLNKWKRDTVRMSAGIGMRAVKVETTDSRGKAKLVSVPMGAAMGLFTVNTALDGSVVSYNLDLNAAQQLSEKNAHIKASTRGRVMAAALIEYSREIGFKAFNSAQIKTWKPHDAHIVADILEYQDAAIDKFIAALPAPADTEELPAPKRGGKKKK